MRCPRCKQSYTISGWDGRVKTRKALKRRLANDPQNCFNCVPPVQGSRWRDGRWREGDLPVLELDMTKEDWDKAEEEVGWKGSPLKGKKKKKGNKEETGIGNKDVVVKSKKKNKKTEKDGFTKVMKNQKDKKKKQKRIMKKQKKGNKKKAGIGNKELVVKGKKEKTKKKMNWVKKKKLMHCEWGEIESGDENQSRWPPPEIISEEEARKLRIAADTTWDGMVEEEEEGEGVA